MVNRDLSRFVLAGPAVFGRAWARISSRSRRCYPEKHGVEHVRPSQWRKALFRRGRRRSGRGRAGDAGEADACPAARRTGVRPCAVQAGLLGLRRHRPGHLLRSPRQRAQQRQRSKHLEPGPMGRRRERPVRCARHREADRVRAFVRRVRGAGLCDAPSGPSGETDPRQHWREGRIRQDLRDVRAHRRAPSARDRAGLLLQHQPGEPRKISRSLPAALSRAADRQSDGHAQHPQERNPADVQRSRTTSRDASIFAKTSRACLPDAGDGRRTAIRSCRSRSPRRSPRRCPPGSCASSALPTAATSPGSTSRSAPSR